MTTQLTYQGHLPAGVFAETPTDRAVIPQGLLDISQKTRSNPLEWKGQFSPQFVEALVGHYRTGEQRVLDPFAGSGTVLLESARAGLAAVGLEVNPAAANLARVYTLSRLSQNQRALLVSRFLKLTAPIDGPGPLFDAASKVADPADALLHAWEQSSNGEFVEGLPELLAAMVTLADFYKRPVAAKKVASLRTRLAALVTSLPPGPHGGIAVRLADARHSGLPAGEIDLVITSPPYINVFNYHQKYRASVEAMGWQVLRAARSEIGSNRKHRQNRVLTVIQYALDMARVLTEMRRVLSETGTAVFVVGRESMVRKTAFYNGEIIAEVAVQACGFNLALKQERVFMNRFGQAIYEDILHLTPKSGPVVAEARDKLVRAIVRQVLLDATVNCPTESRFDIESALEAVEAVQPSPILDPAQLREEDKS